MSHSSLTICFFFSPHSFVFGTIWPKLYTYSISLPSFFIPLSFI
jgi:hypothetical protein